MRKKIIVQRWRVIKDFLRENHQAFHLMVFLSVTGYCIYILLLKLLR